MEKVTAAIKSEPEWKKTICALHKKFYGGVEKKKETIAMARFSDGLSRADLMMQAKRQGIKNFRILNKEELVKVIDEDTTADERNKIVSEAVAKWKQGWGNRKEKVVVAK